jgi:hypothetical protein
MHAREFHYDGVGFRIMIEDCVWCDWDLFIFSHVITIRRYTSNA